MGLREQAAQDAQSILEDSSSGFGWPFTLISPLGVAVQRVGFTTDVGHTIDPETGQAVAGRRASVAVSLRSLTEMPTAVAESTRKPWIVGFLSALGVGHAFKVIEVLPDRAAGVVVLLLEAYQLATVYLASASLALPSLLLAGTVTPAVDLAGALALPSLALAGTVTPAVSLAGSLTLPSLTLAGTLAPTVGNLVGSLALPSLTLAGTVTPAVSLAGSLTLPSLALAGTVTPAVSLAGSLTLPSLALAGTVTPAVSLAGSLALPSLTLAGTVTVAADVITAWLENTATAGAVSSVTDLRSANPATQPTAGFQPTATTFNGFPALTYDGTDDGLIWPVATSSNTASPRRGFAFWFRPATVTGVHYLIDIESAVGSNPSISFFQNGAFLECIVYFSQFSARRAKTPNIFTLNVPAFITWEFDGGQAAEADKCIITVGNVKQALTFVNDAGSPNTMPTTLTQPSGAVWIGKRNISSTNGQGTYGKHLWTLGGAGGISGGGLWTTAQRAAAMAYQPMA